MVRAREKLPDEYGVIGRPVSEHVQAIICNSEGEPIFWFDTSKSITILYWRTLTSFDEGYGREPDGVKKNLYLTEGRRWVACRKDEETGRMLWEEFTLGEAAAFIQAADPVFTSTRWQFALEVIKEQLRASIKES